MQTIFFWIHFATFLFFFFVGFVHISRQAYYTHQNAFRFRFMIIVLFFFFSLDHIFFFLIFFLLPLYRENEMHDSHRRTETPKTKWLS